MAIFVPRNSEPVAVVSNDLFERRGQPLGVNSSVRECDDGEAVAEQFQCPQRRLTAVPTSPEILIPEKLVANLMRHKRLNLVGVEEIERPFRDQPSATDWSWILALNDCGSVHPGRSTSGGAFSDSGYCSRGRSLTGSGVVYGTAGLVCPMDAV